MSVIITISVLFSFILDLNHSTIAISPVRATSLPPQGFSVQAQVVIQASSLEFPNLYGSPGRIRTSDRTVNSRLLYH